MKVIFTVALTSALLASALAGAATLPGFRVERLGSTSGFLTSLAVDSKGTVYYTAQDGSIYRFVNGRSVLVARVASVGLSDAGLLGMALFDDDNAAVHYTTPVTLAGADPELVTYDVISRIDLRTGAETLLHRFACDIDVPERGVSPEHHGGNPVIAPDGSVFVGIGEYSGRTIAQLPNWNGGKLWRVYTDGTAVQYVLGLRNPFDFVWDDVRQRLIIPDNGPIGREDELNVVTLGANCGWPLAFGYEPHPSGMVPPVYVWQETIVPTGTLALSGANDQLRYGITVTGFYSGAIHYIPDIDTTPLPDPIVVVDMGNEQLVDIAEAPDGAIYIGSGYVIYRVVTPRRGDCNGDGLVNAADLGALTLELADAPQARISAQEGSYRGSWGCDVDNDDRITVSDRSALAGMLGRRRSVRRKAESRKQKAESRNQKVFSREEGWSDEKSRATCHSPHVTREPPFDSASLRSASLRQAATAKGLKMRRSNRERRVNAIPFISRSFLLSAFCFLPSAFSLQPSVLFQQE